MGDLSDLNWAEGYSGRSAGPLDHTYTATYNLRRLVNAGLIAPHDGNGLLLDSILSDMAWEVTWREDYNTPDEGLAERFADADGYVIFVHGWTGTHSIWELLPALVAQANRRLICIAVDHNGFGESQFVRDPRLDECNPPAAMRVIQRWVDVLKLRRQPGDSRQKVINFVGHSMGGATLFYSNPLNWRYGEETRYALAPALLLEDEIKQTFYNSMGVGLGLVNRIPAFELIYRAVKPYIISILCTGATDHVKEMHRIQSDIIPRGTTGATIMAMGSLRDWEIPRNFDLFRVMLGHRDQLVGLTPMLDLLCKLEFPVSNIRVIPGTHYMFSDGADYAFQHAQGRELVADDIISLHERAFQMQKVGPRVGSAYSAKLTGA